MPYTTLTAGTVITASWANASVRDQVVTPFASAAARTSAITSPVEGMLTYLADSDRLEVYNGTNWVTVGPRTVVKSANESVTSSTTLQDDDDLTLAVEANTSYAGYGVLFYTGADAADIKLAFTQPASSTCHWFANGAGINAISSATAVGSQEHFAVQGSTASPTATSSYGVSNGTNTGLSIHLTLVTAGTAGNLRLQWAQLVSSGTATTVYAGSRLTLWRITGGS